MKSLLNRLIGRSTPESNRPTRRFQPRFQALESRLLLAGDGCDPVLQPQDRVDVIETASNPANELITKVYPVGDLVMPIQSSATQGLGGGFGGGLGGGDGDVGNHGPSGNEGTPRADFQSLIDLIMTTENENAWDVEDRPESTTPLDSTLNLVVGQSQQVHDEIVDLLEQLRRLQDLQVTIEVRFITVQDKFFEQIGVDFDFDVDDNASAPEDAVTRTDVGPTTVVGVDPDLIFGQNESGSPNTNLGGFEPSAATIGFAILSDIEAFFIIQAAQGDAATSVQQAPKVTLFDGQFASINDTESRPFVVSVIPVVG